VRVSRVPPVQTQLAVQRERSRERCRRRAGLISARRAPRALPPRPARSADAAATRSTCSSQDGAQEG